MPELIITIPGKPIAKKRPKFFRRGGFVGAYNCQETEEGKFMLLAKSQLPDNFILFSGPVSVTTVFYLPRPKSHFGTGKNSEVLKARAPINHISKPDIDNLQKTVFDCLNQIVWVDDACIFESTAMKQYSDRPRTIIKIVEVEE